MKPVLNKVATFRICSFTINRQCGHTFIWEICFEFFDNTILLTLETGGVIVVDKVVADRPVKPESVPFKPSGLSKQQLY